MPRIPSDNINRGVSTDVRAAAPTEDDSIAKALGNLGETGRQLFTKLKKKADTSDFLDWRSKYDNTFRESRASFMQDLKQADDKGAYDYEGMDADGNPVSRTGNIFKDRARLQTNLSKLSAEGDGLVLSEEAKRHYSSKENQMGAKLSLDITSHMNKKRQDKVGASLQLDFDNMLMDTKSGIIPNEKDLESFMEKFKPTSMESSVLGEETMKRNRGRFLASMGQAIISNIGNFGETEAMKSMLKKMEGQFDERTTKRMEVGIAQAKKKYEAKVITKATDEHKKLTEINNSQDYEVASAALPTVNKKYLSVGDASESKMLEVAKSLAKASHYETRALVGGTVPKIASSEQAEEMMKDLLDTPNVQQFGVERFKQMVLSQTNVFDSEMATKFETDNAEFLVMQDPEIEKDMKAAGREGTALESLRTGFVMNKVSRESWSFARPTLVKRFKETFDKELVTSGNMVNFINQWDTYASDIRETVVAQLAEQKAIPKSAVAIHHLPKGDELADIIAKAEITFEDNRDFSKTGIHATDDGKGGISSSRVGKMVQSHLDEHYVLPRTPAAGDQAYHDGVRDAFEKVVFLEIASRPKGESFGLTAVDEIITRVGGQFAEKFVSVTGGSSGVIFTADKIKPPVGVEKDVVQRRMEDIMRDPEELLNIEELEVDYKEMKKVFQGRDLSSDSDAMRAFAGIEAEKDPAKRKRIFNKFIAPQLTVVRSAAYNNEITLMYGDAQRMKPVPLAGKNGSVAFSLSDDDFIGKINKDILSKYKAELDKLEPIVETMSKSVAQKLSSSFPPMRDRRDKLRKILGASK